ncbi:glucose dehydrogenase [FAD, quinone]-like [Diabrotica undecimpunctata]|uniref:glucose dehydrogenase [FAD, quinone]-like n=1 Tax=Diabrotica undecimpunctata TaxID=50387 RepID=UPI003B63D437
MKTTYLILIVILALVLKTTSGELYVFIGKVISFLIEFARLQTVFLPFYPETKLYTKTKPEYDFIIIGSGPSGAVVANRLTENSNVNVLMLEQGFEPGLIADVPIIAGALEFSSYNYGYKSEPQEHFCRACTDKRMEWPHGKVLGGSSVMNYLIFVRGNAHDYDKWEEMGNPGWSYKNMLPLLKKMEDAHVENSDTDYRGTGGHLSVSDVPYRTEMVNSFVNACQEAGHKYLDYNGRKQLGVSYIQATLRNGLRCSAEKAYIRPASIRSNLKIKLNSQVTKILVDKNTKTAYGVEYLYRGKRYYVRAKKEVILSAGALNSPQVLMLSGIGPKDHLNELGIPMLKDLPVGEKMYDHATFPAIMFEVNQSIVLNAVTGFFNPLNYIGVIADAGLFTSIGGVEAINYIKTKYSKDPNPGYPDMELLMIGGALSTDFGFVFRKIFNIPPKVYNRLFGPLENKYVYQVTPVLLHPESYGSIKLNKSNPEGAPLFYANYFSDPENHDIKTFIEGMRELQRINLMPSLQKVGAKLVDIPVPGCENYKFNSDEYWECALRSLIGSYYHQVATCKMGPSSDPEAVVNHLLQVHGIKNLRVIDTSIIPYPPSSHNVGPAYAIGEKGAEILKNHWNI